MRREIATSRPIPRMGADLVIFEFCDDEEMADEGVRGNLKIASQDV